jgi:ketosteroid isomerase-like protein
MRHRTFTFIVAALALCSPTIVMADLSTFNAALATHLKAIEQRNSAAFESTLTSGKTLTFVSLGGKVTRSTEEFKAQMRQWFSDPDWSWQLEELASSVAGQTGVAVYRVRYKDKDPTGKAYELSYVLSLVFAKEGEQWRLVHDQNTRPQP